MKHFTFFILSILSLAFPASAQIGYQVSLLNNATGEPRANERVSVTVKITDSEGKTVCEETKSETSNDFGVISMSVGVSETFANADWSKLPFFIEATVDGHMLGKSQLLSVPVAEYAKKTGSLTMEYLCSKEWINTWSDGDQSILRFNRNNVFEAIDTGERPKTETGTFVIDGNIISTVSGNHGEFYHYNENSNCLINDGGIWK